MRYGMLGLPILLAVSSCGAPGRQAAEQPVIRPNEVGDFRTLYSQNCSGCHGTNGQKGLATEIGGPIYLAIAADTTIRHVIEEGRPGTAMPAFGRTAGGLLTAAQITILVRGIRSWADPGAPGGITPPAYSASQTGDPARGENVFGASCAACHGADGRGARAVANASYLSLVSDQHLRTIIIAGMPHLGMPDWRHHSQPLSDSDVTDVVAWLAAQRPSTASRLQRQGAFE